MARFSSARDVVFYHRATMFPGGPGCSPVGFSTIGPLLAALDPARIAACALPCLSVLVSPVGLPWPRPQEDELEILGSVTRITYRTLSLTPPAAASVAKAGVSGEARAREGSRRPDVPGLNLDSPRLFADNVGTGADPAGVDDANATVPSRNKGGAGRDRGDHETRSSYLRAVHGGDGDGSGRGGGSAGGDGGEMVECRAGASPPDRKKGQAVGSSCEIFIGGEPVVATDIPATLPSVRYCAASQVVAGSNLRREEEGEGGGGGGGTGSRRRGCLEGACWAGTRGAEDLGRRLKEGLVGVFHRGAMSGFPGLVEASLQVVEQRQMPRRCALIFSATRDGKDFCFVSPAVLTSLGR